MPPRPVVVCLSVLAVAIAAILASASRPFASQNVPATVSIVVDRRGTPLDDVTAEELTAVLDDRRVAILGVEPIPAPLDVVVLYDDNHIDRTQTSRANAVVAALLDGVPADWRVGLSNSSQNPPRLVPPSADRELVRRSLRGLLGQHGFGHGGYIETVMQTMTTLEHRARDVRQTPDAPFTAMLLIADRLWMPLSPSRLEPPPRPTLRWWRAHVEFLGAGVPIYGVVPRGLVAPTQGNPGYWVDNAPLTLEMLAADTGGVVLPTSNDRAAIVRRLIDDLQARRRLILDVSKDALLKGRLVVTTSRPGTTVRHARFGDRL
jgi:hypothetical protein